tara:strand:+ start:1409 stop:1642 length:234 start_codon:yes stop_codon:yes gene_type:complete
MMNFYRFLSNIPNSKNVNYINIKKSLQESVKSFSDKNFEKIQNIKKLPLIGASESHSMPIKLDSKAQLKLGLPYKQK